MDEPLRDPYGMFVTRDPNLRPDPYLFGRDSMLRLHSKAIKQLVVLASSVSPAESLGAFAALRWNTERLEMFAILNARRAGWSWQSIATSLGMSKQAVHRRYGRLFPKPRKRRARY